MSVKIRNKQVGIITSVGMVPAIRCHRQNMKTSIINGSEVSRLSVAIQKLIFVVV
ncbi:Uncharacterised protein [Klebsiella pneumoniae]|nr:Uncharacterised protein [Klebsiella pneumoniae]SWS22580.1 Uncharacterised protein [Klebsiella pneumoniae]